MLASWLLASTPLIASAQEGEFSFGAGIEYATGDYGGEVDVDDIYVPLSLSYQGQRVGVRLTVPYVELEFVNATGADGLQNYTHRGLGDVIGALTLFDVLRSGDGSVVLDLTGKVKLPTADENEGLGTGETDYTLQAEIYKFLGRGMLVGTVGYKIRGEPPGVLLDDVGILSLGGLFRLSTLTRGGLFFDYRQSSIPNAPAIREAIALLSRNFFADWRVQGHLVRGFSDTSIEWGAGMSFRRDF